MAQNVLAGLPGASLTPRGKSDGSADGKVSSPEQSLEVNRLLGRGAARFSQIWAEESLAAGL